MVGEAASGMTFEVDPKDEVGDLSTVLDLDVPVSVASCELHDTYFDTADHDLARLGLTLRRRRGGGETAWILQTPESSALGDIRSKSRLTTPPPALAEPLFGVRRGRELVLVASVDTRRTVIELENTEQGTTIQMVDDQSTGGASDADEGTTGHRQVVVGSETGDDQPLLTAIADRLVAAGARLTSTPKRLPTWLSGTGEAPPGADVPRAIEPASLGMLIWSYVKDQCDEIVFGDLAIRLDQPVVHATRVAVRRLRSTLRVFGSVFDADAASALEEELVWLAGLLGEVRDRDILRERYRTHLAELPSDMVLGPVASHIETVLLVERAHHLAQVREAMASDRYLRLLDTLEVWRVSPPFTAVADGPADVVAQFAAKAGRKFANRLRNAGADSEALHSARKAGKRFRYATELSEVAIGKKAAKRVKRLKKLQTLLGEYQDSVVSAEFLRRMGAEAGADGDQNGFTYGILLAQEWARAEKTRKKVKKRYG